MGRIFAFGRNWAVFLKTFNENCFKKAEKSLCEKLGTQYLEERSFFDIESGGNLFSLVTHRLEAEDFSFDCDPGSVQCTHYLRDTCGHSSPSWQIAYGSGLDQNFLNSLSSFDAICSWKAPHHTGNIAQNFKNVISLVKSKLFIFMYNGQGRASQQWSKIKEGYNASEKLMNSLLVSDIFLKIWGRTFLKDFIQTGRLWHFYGKNNRGISVWHDLIDWVKGYPFQVANPEKAYDFKSKGVRLEKVNSCRGYLGCNKFIFSKE